MHGATQNLWVRRRGSEHLIDQRLCERSVLSIDGKRSHVRKGGWVQRFYMEHVSPSSLGAREIPPFG
jgi:hypothetical protein